MILGRAVFPRETRCIDVKVGYADGIEMYSWNKADLEQNKNQHSLSREVALKKNIFQNWNYGMELE